MSETAKPTWDEVYAAYFHRLNDRDVATWHYELFQGPDKIRAVDEDLLIAAIRRCAKQAGQATDGNPRPAKLEAVRAVIFEMLRERRAQNDRPNVECDRCGGTGTVRGVRTLFDAKSITNVVGMCATPGNCLECRHRGQAICYDIAIPCKCTAGQAKVQTGGYENHGAVRKLQDMAWRELDGRVA